MIISFLLLLLTGLASPHSSATSSNSFLVNNKNSSFLTYTANIQSQILFVNGCFYRIRAVLTFEWDGIPGHAPSSSSITNVQLLQDCTSTTQVYTARISNFIYEVSANRSAAVSSLSFEPLNNHDLDRALTDNTMILDLKMVIENAIKDITL